MDRQDVWDYRLWQPLPFTHNFFTDFQFSPSQNSSFCIELVLLKRSNPVFSSLHLSSFCRMPTLASPGDPVRPRRPALPRLPGGPGGPVSPWNGFRYNKYISQKYCKEATYIECSLMCTSCLHIKSPLFQVVLEGPVVQAGQVLLTAPFHVWRNGEQLRRYE